jgi:hypothetical protein
MKRRIYYSYIYEIIGGNEHIFTSDSCMLHDCLGEFGFQTSFTFDTLEEVIHLIQEYAKNNFKDCIYIDLFGYKRAFWRGEIYPSGTIKMEIRDSDK